MNSMNRGLKNHSQDKALGSSSPNQELTGSGTFTFQSSAFRNKEVAMMKSEISHWHWFRHFHCQFQITSSQNFDQTYATYREMIEVDQSPWFLKSRLWATISLHPVYRLDRRTFSSVSGNPGDRCVGEELSASRKWEASRNSKRFETKRFAASQSDL